jgi:chitin disaccharide deacetylase
VSAPAARVLALCVDDVGLVDGVAETALALAAAGRIRAASCVTNAPGWRAAAATLAAADADASPELGLHFNLSEGAPLSADLRERWPRLPGLGRLLVASHLGRLPLAAIGAELRAQADAFADAIGRVPDFIDGHQHVHALPGIRTIVLDAVAAWSGAVAVRSTGRVAGPGAAFKRRIIEASGGRALARALVARGIAHNRVLLGAYDFDPLDYRARMRGWLAAAPAEGGLLFCHPCADARDGAGDPIAAARRSEAAYLGSDAFGADLAEAGIAIGPAWVRNR